MKYSADRLELPDAGSADDQDRRMHTCDRDGHRERDRGAYYQR